MFIALLVFVTATKCNHSMFNKNTITINKLWYIHTNYASYTAREIIEITGTESHKHIVE